MSRYPLVHGPAGPKQGCAGGAEPSTLKWAADTQLLPSLAPLLCIVLFGQNLALWSPEGCRQLPHGYHRICRGPRRTLAPPGKVPGSQGHLPDCVSPLSEGQGACSQASRGRSWEQASLEGSRSGSRVEWGGETSFTPQVLVSLPATMRSHTSPFSTSTKHTFCGSPSELLSPPALLRCRSPGPPPGVRPAAAGPR